MFLRSPGEFDVSSVDLENVGVGDGKVYGELSATISITCPECGDEIGRLEVSGIEVTLGDTRT